MEIEIINEKVTPEKIKFENLEPGTIFQIEISGPSRPGCIALKLGDNKYILLTLSSGDDWFVIGNISIDESHQISKIYGHLVGLKVQP